MISFEEEVLMSDEEILFTDYEEHCFSNDFYLLSGLFHYYFISWVLQTSWKGSVL